MIPKLLVTLGVAASSAVLLIATAHLAHAAEELKGAVQLDWSLKTVDSIGRPFTPTKNYIYYSIEGGEVQKVETLGDVERTIIKDLDFGVYTFQFSSEGPLDILGEPTVSESRLSLPLVYEISRQYGADEVDVLPPEVTITVHCLPEHCDKILLRLISTQAP